MEPSFQAVSWSVTAIPLICGQNLRQFSIGFFLSFPSVCSDVVLFLSSLLVASYNTYAINRVVTLSIFKPSPYGKCTRHFVSIPVYCAGLRNSIFLCQWTAYLVD